VSLWQIHEDRFDPTPKKLHSQETVYTIGNGYFCTRGTFEEGFPGADPATLLYGVFDTVPIAGEELANAPDWLPLQLFVNGERFRLDRGQILEYQRTLDMANGVLHRTVRWESPGGVRLLITIERFASLADEHVGLIRYTVAVEQAEKEVDISLRASLNTAVGNYDLMHWETVDQGHEEDLLWLTSVTRGTGIELTQAMSFASRAPNVSSEILDSDIAPAIRLQSTLAPGASLTAEKIVVMYTSRDGVEPLLTALSSLQQIVSTGYDTQLVRHQEAWQQFWRDEDILIEGDEVAQRGVRYNIYQLRINTSLHDSRASIAAKGLTGFGYRGHVFHDTEIFMLPFFVYTMPEVARNLVMYRYLTLPAARAKARKLGYEGAMYAWESTISGEEMTPPAIIHPETGEIIPVPNALHEIHISASVAHAAWDYWRVSGDDEFMRDYGAEIVLSTALFWGSRVEKNREKHTYEITDILGPDEWHEHVNNNAFTNVMARWNLSIALDALRWLHTYAPEKASALERQLGLTDQHLALWRDIIQRIAIPQDPESGLFEQFDGFFTLPPLEREKYRDRTTSYQGLLGVAEVQKYRIIKQADVLMLLTVLDQDFDLKTKRVNWEYYYPITDHDYGSSLTPAFHVILACELGKDREAYDLFTKGNLVDLENLRGNTPEGIHAACCGAVWQAVVFGFAGLRVTEETYTTQAHLPATWKRLAFSFVHQGKREFVDIRR
jgi:trehalose/maltose hydrolase-like predicted phosphorylase